jgi:hypothetical protein
MGPLPPVSPLPIGTRVRIVGKSSGVIEMPSPEGEIVAYHLDRDLQEGESVFYLVRLDHPCLSDDDGRGIVWLDRILETPDNIEVIGA